MTTVHPLDAATALARVEPDRLLGTTSDAYWNFAGPFGGYLAALFMRAVWDDPRRLGPPVAQTVNFCAAMAKGAFEVAIKLARGGRATQHWSLELRQDDAIVATCTMVCANRRETFAHDAVAAPVVAAPATVPVTAGRRELPWLSAYEFRFVEGLGPTFGERPPPGQLGPTRTVLWLKDYPDRALDFVALSSLADCFILRLLQMRGSMVPMSTVSMTTYFHADTAELDTQAAQPLLGIADAKRFRANFHDQSMELWSADRSRLLASGIQTVWFKE